jgi:hypothetical protein
MSDQPTASGPILLTAVLALAAAATRTVPLPLSIVLMVVLLLAYHLAAAHRTALMIKS